MTRAVKMSVIGVWVTVSIFSIFGFIPQAGIDIQERVLSSFNGELSVADYSGSRYLVAKSERGLLVVSAMSLARREWLNSEENQIIAVLTALHPQPERVFNLGLGGGSLPRYQIHFCEKCTIDSVEIDPQVVRLAQKYFMVTIPRHQIYEGDGWQWLSSHKTGEKNSYDVLWVDAFLAKEGPRVVARASEVKTLTERTAEHGLAIVNLGSMPAQVLMPIARTYANAFGSAILIHAPEPVKTENFQLLKHFSANYTSSVAPAAIIALSPDKMLNCTVFWKRLQELSIAKRVSLSWGNIEETSRACETLR